MFDYCSESKLWSRCSLQWLNLMSFFSRYLSPKNMGSPWGLIWLPILRNLPIGNILLYAKLQACSFGYLTAPTHQPQSGRIATWKATLESQKKEGSHRSFSNLASRINWFDSGQFSKGSIHYLHSISDYCRKNKPNQNRNPQTNKIHTQTNKQNNQNKPPPKSANPTLLNKQKKRQN